jgi:glycosyltransferase involved in cell wall biosynthesis
MSTRRICLIIPTLDLGGAEKQLCLLATGLPRDQFEVQVIALTRLGPREKELRDAGIPLHLIGKSHKFDLTALFRLRKLLIQLRPDIVHTWIFAANCYGRVAARWARVPHLVGGERCVDLWKTGRHLWIDRWLAKYSDCIATNSTGVVNFYTEHGIPSKLFRVIPNGIPPRTAAMISRDEALARLGVAGERRIIGAVGRLWPQKRYRDMINAIDLLGVLRPEMTLVIIGDGPQRDELLRYRDLATDARWVRFTGDRRDVAELLPHFEQFWIASGYEGQSNALMEAMQVGLPIIASDIPGNRDLIRPGENGILFPLGESAELARQSNILFGTPERAQQLGTAAAQTIKDEFSVERMIERHQRLYRSLAG